MLSKQGRFDPALAHTAFAACCALLPPFLTGALFVQIGRDLRIDEAALGLGTAIFFAGSTAVARFAGRRLSHVTASRGVQIALVFTAFTLVTIAIAARSAASIMTLLAIGGVGNGINQVSLNVMLATQVRPAHLGVAFGFKQAAMPAASLLGGFMVPAVALTVGWRWAFVAAALLTLIVAERTPRSDRSVVTDHERTGFGRRPIIILATGAGFGSGAVVALSIFFTGSLVSNGASEHAAGLLLATGSVLGIITRIALGWLGGRMQHGRLLLVSASLGAGAAGYLMLGLGEIALIIPATALAFGAGWGWTSIFNFAVVSSNQRNAAEVSGLLYTGAFGGSLVGSLGFGYLAERVSYAVAWYSAAVMFIIAMCLLLLGRRALRQDQALVRSQP